MTKIIKEIIIMLLVCLVGMLLFAVIFYEFIPNRKVVPEVTQYSTSDKIKEQLSDDIDKQDDQIVKTFEVTSSDLINYKTTKDYVPGKSNPFASPVDDVEANATTNSTTGDNTLNTSTENSTLNSISNNTTNSLFEDQGTK